MTIIAHSCDFRGSYESFGIVQRGRIKIDYRRRTTANLVISGRCSAPKLDTHRPQEGEELFQIHTDLFFELVGSTLPEPENSKQRLLRRIESGRIWIACEQDKIVFKADIATETAEVALIEAVWTAPDLRGHGIGVKALSALCAHLLETYPILVLSLGNDRSHLERFYKRIGFKYHGDYGDYMVVRY